MNIIRDLNLFRVRQNMIENQWDKATRNTNHTIITIIHLPIWIIHILTANSFKDKIYMDILDRSREFVILNQKKWDVFGTLFFNTRCHNCAY